MPTPLGYLTENSLTTYPFKDGSSLRPNGSGVLPLANDAFLDFQFTTTDKQASKVALTRLQTYVDGYGGNLRFTFSVFCAALSVIRLKLYIASVRPLALAAARSFTLASRMAASSG